MSAYRAAAYHPGEGVIRAASWLDDYFGRHQYGVRFDEGGPVFEPSEVEIPSDVIFAPADFDSTRIRAQLDEAQNIVREATADPRGLYCGRRVLSVPIDWQDRARAFLEKAEGK